MSTNNPDSIPDATPSTFVADASVQVSPPTQAEDPFVDPQPEADPFADPEAPPASSKEHKSPAPSIHAASFSGGEYHAAFTVDDLGNVKSHDSVINGSADALLHFIHKHAAAPTQIVAYVRGTTQKVDLKGSRVIEEDFNFTLSVDDLKEAFGVGRLPLVYTAGEWETVDDTSYPVRAAIRLEDDPEAQAVSTEEKASAWSKFKVGGTKVAEGGYRAGARVTEDGYRSASNLITNMKLKAARSARVAQGAPAFIHPASLTDMSSPVTSYGHPALLHKGQFVDLGDVHSSSPLPPLADRNVRYTDAMRERASREEDVRAAVEEYCASKNPFKELTITKEMYGWDWVALRAGIEAVVQSTFFAGQVYVKFNDAPATIRIRPPGLFTSIRQLSIAAKIPLYITLVYPTVLLAAACAPHFNTLHIATPLCRWLPLPAPSSTTLHTPSSAQSLAASLAPTRPAKVSRVPARDSASEKEWVYMVGTQEGEWLKKWEQAIKVAVGERVKGGVTLRLEDGGREGSAKSVLRGYND